ncbi:MAG: aminotransferase class I and II [Desulfuromonas sp.]|nr:MAG: aminotransferase class I and II [Desulfuromonas sp.]
MRYNFSPYVEQVCFPPISEVRSWLAERPDAGCSELIDLCQAVPNYPPPAELTAHLQHLIDDPQQSRYSPDEGLEEVRREVCDWYRRHYGAAPQPQEICLTIGASQAFWLAMMVLCRAGDEVIVQLPAYFDHSMGLQALGVRPVYAPFDPQCGGLPDLATLKTLMTPKTRALLLVSPSNPTGTVIPPETIEALLALANQHGIALVLDETYNAFVDGRPHHLFANPDWQENFVHIASFGKTFSLTGYRAGALVADASFIHHALKVQDSMVVCQPRLTQHALAYGCRNLDAWVAQNRFMMQQRHDRFKELFPSKENRFKLVASGGFFAWVHHPWERLSGREAARRMALEANLLVLPGEVFGPGLEPYLRLAFGNIDETLLPEAVARFVALGQK